LGSPVGEFEPVPTETAVTLGAGLMFRLAKYVARSEGE